MILEFDIHGFWHVGTGRGAGPFADAVVLRDRSGLPHVPGKQVKGLLRDATEHATRCGVLPKGSASRWFGSSIHDALDGEAANAERREQDLEAMRFATREGVLTIGSAVLGRGRAEAETWRRWAATHPALVAEMYRPFSSTKVDDEGVAQNQTLRSIEVVVPMKLYAEVEGPTVGEHRDWLVELPRVLSLIDGVGGHRNRGFGRVTVRVESAR